MSKYYIAVKPKLSPELNRLFNTLGSNIYRILDGVYDSLDAAQSAANKLDTSKYDDIKIMQESVKKLFSRLNKLNRKIKNFSDDQFSTNKYIKSESDFEKYQDVANAIWVITDKSGKVKVNGTEYDWDYIYDCLFGDSNDGHIVMSVSNAMDLFSDLMLGEMHKHEESRKYGYNDLWMTCEYVRAFGM